MRLLPVSAFEIDVEIVGGTAVVSVFGELDLYTSPELERRLQELDGAEDVLIDLSDVDFLDSTALAVLLGAARRRPERLEVVLEQPELRRIFAITGVERRFRFVPPPDAAA